MNDHILHKLGLGRKLLLTTAAALAITIPVTIGLFTATPSRAQSQPVSSDLQAPVFSSVSIKLSEPVPNEQYRMKMMLSSMDGSFVAKGVTLRGLIQIAYRVQDSQLAGGPDWLNTAKFDVEAKLDPAFVAAMHQQMSEHKAFEDADQKPVNDQALVRSLLADKFKLSIHSENRNLAVYDLVDDVSGPKLQPVDKIRFMTMQPGQLISQGSPIDLLAAQLSTHLGRAVVDKTGMKGSYAFNLHWTPDPDEIERLKQGSEEQPGVPAFDPNGPSLFTAVQEHSA